MKKKNILIGIFIIWISSCKIYRCVLKLAPSDYSYLKIGQKAPDFETEYVSEENTTPKKIKLSNFLGKRVILYFYPKDGTPFCKMQAKSFGDYNPTLKKLNYEVIGISTDTVAKHNWAIKKYKIPFKLLLDPKHKIHSKYGAWGKKGAYRISFVIDEKGFISNIIIDVKVRNHAIQILEYDNRLD